MSWWDGDSQLEKLMDATDADELCRLLLATPFGWGSSTRQMEAVELFRKVHGTGEIPPGLLAMLLCSCARWDRVTSRLVAAIEASGLLCGTELDELAESVLAHELVIAYPLAWVSPQWLGIDLGDGKSVSYTVNQETLGQHRPTFEPPLRRWAARRALMAEPERLDELLSVAARFAPRHRDAMIHGLLDVADVLEEAPRRRLAQRGMKAAQAGVRRSALERLCELDGPEQALRRARCDPNATVRQWRPTRPETAPAARLFRA